MNDKSTKLCPICGMIFLVRGPSELKTRKYCSKICQANSIKKPKVALICKTCDKTFEVPPCLSAIAKYCSKKCKHIGTRKIKDLSQRQCSRCNKILPIENFSNFRDYRCKKCQRLRFKKQSRTPQGRFTVARCAAKRRNLEWNIPKETYFQLIKMNCHYCSFFLNETGIGLDRKDNTKGYTVDNVVPCCKDCNRTRSDHYTYEEMLLLAPTIKLIKENRLT